jgi:hypothetical protein
MTDNEVSQSNFLNYYTELDITGCYKEQEKIIEEKKCTAIPIVFEDVDGNVEEKNSISVKCEWNFHETENYLIIFWPVKYDFFKAILYKMMNKPY